MSVYGLWQYYHTIDPQSLDTLAMNKRLQSALKRSDVPLAASSFCHLQAVRTKLAEMESRLTLYVSDRSQVSTIPKGSKFLLISHPSLGDDALEVTKTGNGQIVQMSIFNKIVRVESRFDEVCFFFNGRMYRCESTDTFIRIEDPTLFDEAVWVECKEWLDFFLRTLNLPQSREGWVRFFDALPWRSCGYHVQRLRQVYDVGYVNVCPTEAEDEELAILREKQRKEAELAAQALSEAVSEAAE